MANCRATPRNTNCTTIATDPVDTTVFANCEPFEVCLGLGRVLRFDGTCFSIEGSTSTPDGKYNYVIIRDGCLYDVGNEDYDTVYTPPPCTPAPVPCGDGGDISLVIADCNLITQTPDGAYQANLYVESGTGVSVVGCGSITNPLIISADISTGSSTALVSGTPDVIIIQGTGNTSDPYVISLASRSVAGTYGAFTFDQYGMLVSYDASGESAGIQQIVAGPGISVDVTGGVATIGLEAGSGASGTYLLGGYNVTVNLAGLVTSVTPGISISPGVYDPHANLFTVNGLGSITAITPAERREDTRWSKVFTGNLITMTITFETSIEGSLLISAKTNFGSAPAGVDGLRTLPAAIGISIDGRTEGGWAVVGGGQYIGVECRANSVLAPGLHTVTIEQTDEVSQFTGPSIIDVSLMQIGT